MRTGMRITSSGVVGYRICISANIFSRRTGRRCGDRRGPGRRKTPRGGAYRGKRPGNGAGADKVPEGYPWDAQAQSASRERRGGYAQCGTGAGFQCRPAAADAILNLRWRGGRAVECGGLLIRCTGIMPVPRVRIPPSPPDSIGGMRTVGDGRWRGPIACAVAFLDRRGGVRPLEDGMADDGSRLVAVARETDRIKASAIVDRKSVV